MSDAKGIERRRYRFLWGAATAPYQVEGGITNNDWDFFTRSEPIKKRILTLTKPSIFYKSNTQIVLQPAGDAVEFWNPKYYEKDFDLARSLGLNTFRIGIEWAMSLRSNACMPVIIGFTRYAKPFEKVFLICKNALCCNI